MKMKSLPKMIVQQTTASLAINFILQSYKLQQSNSTQDSHETDVLLKESRYDQNLQADNTSMIPVASFKMMKSRCVRFMRTFEDNTRDPVENLAQINCFKRSDILTRVRTNGPLRLSSETNNHLILRTTEFLKDLLSIPSRCKNKNKHSRVSSFWTRIISYRKIAS